MEGLLGSCLLLLLILIAFGVMLGGSRFTGGLFDFGSGLIGCLAKIVIGLAVLCLFLAVSWQLFLSAFRSPVAIDVKTHLEEAGYAARFDYPVGDPEVEGRRSGKGWQVTQDFADSVNFPKDHPHLAGQHMGEDWWTTEVVGQPIYAVAVGEVIFAGENRSYGHVVLIRHLLPPESEFPYIVSLYGHLGARDLFAAGATVRRGEAIGRVGARGENGVDPDENPWPPHLHFELRSPETGHPDDWIGPGYLADLTGLLNPTDTTSPGNRPGGGWIDRHR